MCLESRRRLLGGGSDLVEVEGRLRFPRLSWARASAPKERVDGSLSDPESKTEFEDDDELGDDLAVTRVGAACAGS